MADAASGPWPLVILNTGLFVLFAVSFIHPKTERDWRARFGDARRSYAATTPGFVPRRRPPTVEHNRQPSRRPR